MMVLARILAGGPAEGAVLVLDEPLSFWGGFDPRTGLILDVHHPQAGQCISGTVTLMSESRGSGSAPGAIAEAVRLGTAPAAVILAVPDVNLAVGVEVAATLYGRNCTIACVSADDLARLHALSRVRITADGVLTPV